MSPLFVVVGGTAIAAAAAAAATLSMSTSLKYPRFIYHSSVSTLFFCFLVGFAIKTKQNEEKNGIPLVMATRAFAFVAFIVFRRCIK